MESVRSPGRARALGGVRTAGLLCAVGGVGWMVNGLAFLVFSRPDDAAFAVSEMTWIAVQSLLLVGVVGLALSGAAPGWFGAVALGIALLGRADFVAAEVHSLAIGEESVLLPVGALVMDRLHLRQGALGKRLRIRSRRPRAGPRVSEPRPAPRLRRHGSGEPGLFRPPGAPGSRGGGRAGTCTRRSARGGWRRGDRFPARA